MTDDDVSAAAVFRTMVICTMSLERLDRAGQNDSEGADVIRAMMDSLWPMVTEEDREHLRTLSMLLGRED